MLSRRSQNWRIMETKEIFLTPTFEFFLFKRLWFISIIPSSSLFTSWSILFYLKHCLMKDFPYGNLYVALHSFTDSNFLRTLTFSSWDDQYSVQSSKCGYTMDQHHGFMTFSIFLATPFQLIPILIAASSFDCSRPLSCQRTVLISFYIMQYFTEELVATA